MVIAPAPALETQQLQRRTRPAFIDCDLHNELDSVKDLYPYLSARWRAHIETFGLRSPAGADYPRFMGHREDARPPSGRLSGSELAFMRSHFLDPMGVAFGILNPLTPAGKQQNLDLDAALATAANDWQVAEWLDPEPRLRASIVIPLEDPPAAVREIRRRAADSRFVQVLFSGRPHEPMGRRKYWPIYEACAENGLHVASHAFGSFGQATTGTGYPSFYIEEHVGPAQAMQANLLSMVAEGVFERFPTLRVISVENGFAWLPSLAWRMDGAWELLHDEVPHLTRPPSEYLRDHVYITTQPMEEPPHPAQFMQLLDHYGGPDRLLFATDYPHWDFDHPDTAFPARLSADMQRRIYIENARALYRLPSAASQGGDAP